MRLSPLLAASALLAQQGTTIRVDIQQVLVPVIVTDKKGHHAGGLRASDFKIFEDGVEQKIAAFSSDTAASTDDINALGKPSVQTGPRRTFVICVDTLHTAPANAVRLRESLESLFGKEKPSDAQYVLIGIGRQMQVLQTATGNPLELLLKVRGPGFQNATGGLDASALSAELQNLRARMDQFCRGCACGPRAGMRNCDSEIDSLKQSVDAQAERWTGATAVLADQFKSVVEELAKIPTGRTLILVSDGFDVNPKRQFYDAVAAYLPNRPQFRQDESPVLPPALREAVKSAEDRNISIYCVDSRGAATPNLIDTGPMDAGSSGGSASNYSILGTNRSQASNVPSLRSGTLQNPAAASQDPFPAQTSASMAEMAAATGGVYFHGTADMAKNLRNALAEGREYYVLAYLSTNSAQDGKFRAIAVETADQTLNIRAKSGYWAPSGSDQ